MDKLRLVLFSILRLHNNIQYIPVFSLHK